MRSFIEKTPELFYDKMLCNECLRDKVESELYKMILVFAVYYLISDGKSGFSPN
jgi:hypothetical protein